MSLLLFGIMGAVRGTPWALEGFGGQRVLALVSWGLIVLVAGNFLRRFVFGPWVTVSRDGLSFRGNRLAWAEVREVRLTRRTVLVITPLNGRTRRIGRFGDDGTRLHQALCQFAGASYSRENTPV